MKGGTERKGREQEGGRGKEREGRGKGSMREEERREGKGKQKRKGGIDYSLVFRNTHQLSTPSLNSSNKHGNDTTPQTQPQ